MTHAIILGGSSDIGEQIGVRLLNDGWRLSMTYRQMDLLKQKEISSRCLNYIRWDARSLTAPYITTPWDLLISCIGTMEPIGPFVKTNGAQMENIGVNLMWPLRGLNALMKYHNPNASIMFFGGMNTNSAHPNYFAYSIAKVATIKAMELLDAELPDCKCFALGPGYIPTKMHEQIRRAGLEPTARLKGASHDDVYECLMWAHGQPKSVIGGRNIAVHTDDWRNPMFAEQLAAHPETYKLRRFTNGQ